MDMDAFLAWLGANQWLVLVVVGLIVTILVIVGLARLRHAFQTQLAGMRSRLDTLWHEMDFLRVQQLGELPVTASGDHGLAAQQYDVEKAVFEQLWPIIWDLHDKLGIFLRAVDSSEAPGEIRLAARTAALNARATVNSLRPFYSGQVDELLTRLIDTEIKAHLAACQYLEHRHSGINGSLEMYQETFRLLYEEEAKELLSRLVELMRRRMLRSE